MFHSHRNDILQLCANFPCENSWEQAFNFAAITFAPQKCGWLHFSVVFVHGHNNTSSSDMSKWTRKR
jgi:hypothetical protein